MLLIDIGTESAERKDTMHKQSIALFEFLKKCMPVKIGYVVNDDEYCVIPFYFPFKFKESNEQLTNHLSNEREKRIEKNVY